MAHTQVGAEPPAVRRDQGHATGEKCMAKRKRSSLSSSSRCASVSRRVFGFAQRAFDRRHQPRAALLEHIIDGALFQGLNGALLADGARDEDEGCVGPARSGDLQRLRAVESRQRVVG